MSHIPSTNKHYVPHQGQSAWTPTHLLSSLYMTGSCGLLEAPAETATAEWDHFLYRCIGRNPWRPTTTQTYVSHTSFIYHLLQTLPTCVTSKNSCWYHCSVQITVVAYIFSEAPVWMWKSEDSFKHGLLCHGVRILEWSSPWQRCCNITTVGNLYMRVCLYKYRIGKMQKKGRFIRTTVSGDGAKLL